MTEIFSIQTNQCEVRTIPWSVAPLSDDTVDLFECSDPSDEAKYREYLRMTKFPSGFSGVQQYNVETAKRKSNGNDLALAAIIVGGGFLIGGPIGFTTTALFLTGCFGLEDIGGPREEKIKGENKKVADMGHGNDNTQKIQDAGTATPDMYICEENPPRTEIPYDSIDNDCDGITDADSWIRVGAGGRYSCGLRTDNTIECWGSNNFDQRNAPEGTFTQISVGEAHACAIKESNNDVECWGHNDYGQSGDQVGDFIQVSACALHSCALRESDTIYCWGNNAFGQLDEPSGSFTQISVGSWHACGVRSNDTVACWGINEEGQCNDSPGTECTGPSGNFIQVSGGGLHTCGLRLDNTIRCWGDNEYGQATDPPGEFIQIGAGYRHNCGVKTDNTAYCWGYDEYGQATPPEGISFIQVSAGYYHSCGITIDDTIECWGSDSEGQSTFPLP